MISRLYYWLFPTNCYVYRISVTGHNAFGMYQRLTRLGLDYDVAESTNRNYQSFVFTVVVNVDDFERVSNLPNLGAQLGYLFTRPPKVQYRRTGRLSYTTLLPGEY